MCEVYVLCFSEIPLGDLSLRFFFFSTSPPYLGVTPCWIRPERGDREMVVDGGGHFNHAGIDGVHTLTLLFSSLTAHHRAEGNPHTQELIDHTH